MERHVADTDRAVPRSMISFSRITKAGRFVAVADRTPVVIAGMLAVSGVLAACGPPRDAALPAAGDRVVLVISGTGNEPRPSTSGAALEALRATAESANVTNRGTGKSSVAIVGSADGGTAREILLTPRRADGSLEHGLRRPALVDRNVRAVADAVADTTATKSGLDLLEGIGNAVRGVNPGILIIVSNGLSTSGAFDLRQVGWDADPPEVADRLAAKNALPHLRNWRVLFTGLGATAGTQPPLSVSAREKLGQYWSAICRRAEARMCDIDEKRVPADPPRATVANPAVPVPGVTSVVGQAGQVNTTVSDSALGFAGDSAVLSPAAEELLAELAAGITARLAGDLRAVVTVRGYAADPPGSTATGRGELADRRAHVVAEALELAGVRQRIDAAGVGSEPGRSAMLAGRFDEAAAAAMRRVEITY